MQETVGNPNDAPLRHRPPPRRKRQRASNKRRTVYPWKKAQPAECSAQEQLRPKAEGDTETKSEDPKPNICSESDSSSLARKMAPTWATRFSQRTIQVVEAKPTLHPNGYRHPTPSRLRPHRATTATPHPLAIADLLNVLDSANQSTRSCPLYLTYLFTKIHNGLHQLGATYEILQPNLINLAINSDRGCLAAVEGIRLESIDTLRGILPELRIQQQRRLLARIRRDQRIAFRLAGAREIGLARSQYQEDNAQPARHGQITPCGG